ncbi:hypothetical protein BJX70DRAFT_360189 [Aspergillus crustosus]
MMSRKGFIVDELWHALCPVLSRNTHSRHDVTLSATRRLRHPALVPSSPASRCLQKRYSSEAARYHDDQHHRYSGGTDLVAKQLASLKQERRGYLKAAGHAKTLANADAPMHLKGETPQKLEARLIKMIKQSPKVPSALQLLLLLIRDHKIHPTAQHYRWLIQCNVDSSHGSPNLVRRLLEELQDTGILADSATLHAALQVAAVHPDYILRHDLLRTMRDQWLPLSPEGWHSVVAGQIREHQFELALDSIATMGRKDIPVQEWLHSLLIYYLCEFQELDQVLELIKSRLSEGHIMTDVFWTHVLEAAASRGHYELTSYIWKRVVEPGIYEPDPQFYAQVMGMTRHEGELTTSVLRSIAQNNIKLEPEHYLKWCEARAANRDLAQALIALCEMQKAGFVVPRSIIKPIMVICREDSSRPREVLHLLKGLKFSGHVIPLACARLIIELFEMAAAGDPFEVDDGIAFYKQLHLLCPERPDTDIYNALLSMCRAAQNTDSAMFIIEEMSAFGILPDATTFEHLVLMCLDHQNFESSYSYSQDMHEQGFEFSQEARIQIRNCCTGSDDEYAIRLMNSPRVYEDSPASIEEKSLNKQSLSPKEWAELLSRRSYNKSRRKEKRRQQAIERGMKEEDCLEYEPSLSTPKDLLAETEGGKI